MLKKLTTLLMLLTPALLLAAELSADTPAVEPSTLDSILRAVLIGVSTLIGWLITNAIPLLNSYFKAHMHFRGSEIVADALAESIAAMSTEVQKALADGIITDAEKQKIKAKAREIAKDKLQRLSGFYKGDLVKWIDEQLEVGLGKLLLIAGLKMK